jgi:hypothetical protein
MSTKHKIPRPRDGEIVGGSYVTYRTTDGGSTTERCFCAIGFLAYHTNFATELELGLACVGNIDEAMEASLSNSLGVPGTDLIDLRRDNDAGEIAERMENSYQDSDGEEDANASMVDNAHLIAFVDNHPNLEWENGNASA